MEKRTLGFIGMGNMASAILRGAVKAGYLTGDQVWAYDVNPEKLDEMEAACGIHRAADLADLADRCEILLLAVKPQHLLQALEEMGERLSGKVLVSIAAGWDYKRYREVLPAATRVCFVMPNTPCLVGEGMALIEGTNDLTTDELDFTAGLFDSIGSVATLPSELMSIGGTLSGCGPAFLYMVAEALADAACAHGLPRKLAYQLAGQMILGSGKMVLESGEHPGQLKDNVCSPGGTTIKGVKKLEECGLRGTLIQAIDAIEG